jgi:DNA-binding response OmpR family regulator
MQTSIKTILLIESNPDILENFTEYLEMEGFNILAAKSGNAGVMIARACIPDLIISEILIQEMDGYEVLRLLLNSPQTSEIPFIFCTTQNENSDRVLALTLGADDYIVKPNSMERLYMMANRWIESGSKRQVHN